GKVKQQLRHQLHAVEVEVRVVAHPSDRISKLDSSTTNRCENRPTYLRPATLHEMFQRAHSPKASITFVDQPSYEQSSSGVCDDSHYSSTTTSVPQDSNVYRLLLRN
ncbi:unnamed protein product, partial [Ectocarpus fasciculatus]